MPTGPNLGAFLYALASGAECSNSVCSLEHVNKKGLQAVPTPEPSSSSTRPDNNDNVDELVNLGWSAKDASRALAVSNFDVSEAANLLYSEEDADELFKEKVAKIGEMGWNDAAAESSLRECNGNETAAVELLNREEAGILSQFQGAVSEMLESGWDEVVARRALLAQWTLDQRKAIGVNSTTLTPEALAEIRPTLRRLNETKAPYQDGAKPQPPRSSNNKSKSAKKEDCVFEVTSSNFQKIVLESPVPVVLDVYADWCGPCKQLGPMLEEAAMQSGGIFRLAKVNSDAERSIAESLQVSGLPTVFSMNQGRFTDRFVGMLPQEELQQDLVRSVTGYGRRVQSDMSEADLARATAKMAMMAGLAAINSKQREMIRKLVDQALDLEGGLDADGTMSEAMRTAMLYIGNAAKHVRDVRYRNINCTSKAYSGKVSGSPAACKLLEVAGFRRPIATRESPSILTLVHSNAAVLTLVSQRAEEAMQKCKYGQIKDSVDMELGGENRSLRRKKISKKEKGRNFEVEKAEESKVVTPTLTSTASRGVKAAALSRPLPDGRTKVASKRKIEVKKTGTHTLLSTSSAADKKGEEL